MSDDKKFYNNERTDVVERYAGQDPYRAIFALEKELAEAKEDLESEKRCSKIFAEDSVKVTQEFMGFKGIAAKTQQTLTETLAELARMKDQAGRERRVVIALRTQVNAMDETGKNAYRELEMLRQMADAARKIRNAPGYDYYGQTEFLFRRLFANLDALNPQPEKG